LALLLVFFSDRIPLLSQLRGGIAHVLSPLYSVADSPSRIGGWFGDNLVSRGTLLEQNAQLRNESLILKAKLQKMAALAAENVRLRELLNSSEVVDSSVLVAELIAVSPDPLSHEVVLNKGTRDGVYKGVPVLDAQGLMGQVIEVSPTTSRAILIADSSHATPVQINRNGVRAIATGTGKLHELELRHVAATTDVKVGDLLVSSGLGGRFPVGYPVAVVSSVVHSAGSDFATVKALPKAQLNRSRYVLLAFTEARNGEVADDE
jgi:rod shape-determining protein MreC